MQATFVKPTNGINAKSHRKENKFQEEFCAVVFDDGKFSTPVKLRIYGTQAQNYACLWVNDNKSGIHCNGSGKAGGWGYHRPSQAAEYAMQTAGIELDKPIGGRGDSVTEEAVSAICRALGYKTFFIHKANG